MVTIGITGGIGSGKSVVSRFLTTCGYPVYDTDIMARRLMVESDEIRSGMTALLGDVYVGGELNRKRIATEIFNNKDILKQVNSIVHPVVRRDFSDWARRQDRYLVFLESAILFETGFYRSVSKVWMVTAPEELRISRVILRNNLSREEVKTRMAAQMCEEEKCVRADSVIYNDNVHAIIPQILNLIETEQE